MYSTKTNQTKQNGAIETVLTKLYSEEMVTKTNQNMKNEFFGLPSVPFSTAVLAAWFKFPQTKEVQPLVHKREKHFTNLE